MEKQVKPHRLGRVATLGLLCLFTGCGGNKPQMRTDSYSYAVSVSSNCVAHVTNYHSYSNDRDKFSPSDTRTLSITKTLEDNQQVTAYLDSVINRGNDYWRLLRIDGKNPDVIRPYLTQDKLRAIVNMNGDWPDYAFTSF